MFRSDAFHALTAEDRRRFGELGLRVIYDLRSDVERTSHPNALPEDDALRSVDLALSAGEDETGGLPPLDRLLEGSGLVLRLYRGMVANAAPVFGALLSGLAEPDALPAVFHCLWGKDRTGVAAALLLSVLGVPQPDVIEDYMLTEQYRSQEVVQIALARPRTPACLRRPQPVWCRHRVGRWKWCWRRSTTATAASRATCSARRP